jgi:hypothetical protein
MNVQELFENNNDVVAMMLKIVDAAMDRSSHVDSFGIENEAVYFNVGYDFPEHRIGVVKKVRGAAKPLGKLNAQQGGGSSWPCIDFQFLPTKPFTDQEVKDITTALRAKHKDAQ